MRGSLAAAMKPTWTVGPQKQRNWMPIGRCLTSSSVMATLSLMMPMHLPECYAGVFRTLLPPI